MAFRVFLVIFLVALGGLFGGWLYKKVLHPSSLVSQTPLKPLRVGESAPDFELHDLQGKSHTLSSLKGKVILLNFWASWCPPCLSEMPALVLVHEKLKSDGFEILAVNLDETQKPAERFSKKFKLPFPVLLDPDGKMAHHYLVYGLPYTVLIDRNGKIREKIFGEQVWHEGEAFQKILSLLNEKNNV